MSTRHQVTFTITSTRANGEHCMSVQPTLENIRREDGGEAILLAIAANCVRMVSKHNGLEAALERFQDVVVNRTTIERG